MAELIYKGFNNNEGFAEGLPLSSQICFYFRPTYRLSLDVWSSWIYLLRLFQSVLASQSLCFIYMKIMCEINQYLRYFF